MTHSQLLKAFTFIKTEFDKLTQERFEELAAGDGLYTILEDAVANAFGSDNQGLEDFWKKVNTAYGSTGKSNLDVLSYQIVCDYYERAEATWYQKHVCNPTIGKLKQIMGNVQYVSIHTYNIDKQANICIFKGWIDQIPSLYDSLEVDYVRTQTRSGGLSELLINIGDTILTEEDFNA